MIGEELGDLEEANRELGTLGRYGYYKLKQAAQQIEVLSAEPKELIDEVEDMRKCNRRLVVDVERLRINWLQ